MNSSKSRTEWIITSRTMLVYRLFVELLGQVRGLTQQFDQFELGRQPVELRLFLGHHRAQHQAATDITLAVTGTDGHLELIHGPLLERGVQLEHLDDALADLEGI